MHCVPDRWQWMGSGSHDAESNCMEHSTCMCHCRWLCQIHSAATAETHDVACFACSLFSRVYREWGLASLRFYWWVPDPTFLSLKPKEVTFPPYDRQAYLRGDKRTAPTSTSVDIIVSKARERCGLPCGGQRCMERRNPHGHELVYINFGDVCIDNIGV